MDPTDSHGTGHNESRRSANRPVQSFMFIDSSVQGTNAKPDKAVRSFVMHQARRQKPWSTRQKHAESPPRTAERGVRSKTKPSLNHSQPQPQTHIEVDDSSHEPGPWQEINAVPTAWDAQYHKSELESSPLSSHFGSISSRSGSQPSLTPLFTNHGHSHSCQIPYCTGESCGQTHQTHTALKRRDGFTLRVMDPFDCLPVRMNAKTSSMIKHFVDFISPRLIPVDLHQLSSIATEKWVKSSLTGATSAPFTFAILTTSALHLQALGAATEANVLYYKTRAISEINTMISDNKNSTNDDNIAAVFMLLCLEESQLAPTNKNHGDAEWSEYQRSIHLNGLKAMIEQRGGLANLSSNRCLQTFLLMHSVAHSISTFQRPYANLIDSKGHLLKYDLPSFRPSPTLNRIMWFFRDLKLCPDLFDIISNIVVFTGDLSSWLEDRRCPVDPLELQKHASLLEYRLIDWFIKEGEEEKRNPIDQSICLGLLIFLVKASQPYDPSYRAMILTTVKKLRTALTKVSIFRWADSSDLLLWTLTMGALAAQGSTETGFFARYCGVAFVDAGFDEQTNAEELLDRMRKGLWIPMLFDEEAKSLWVKMGLLRGEEVAGAEDGMMSPEIKEEEVVGMLTSTRFFSGKEKDL